MLLETDNASISETGGAHSTKYRPDIDGLRAIAVSAVIFYHAGISLFRSGFVGVDIFFVISGFLIGGILYRETRSSFSFSDFYARRAKRILPALIAVCLFCVALGYVVLSPKEYSSLSLSTIAALLGISNIRFWMSLGYFNPDAEMDPLLMTWSLGVEEQFYVFFPMLLLLLRSSKKIVVAILILLLSVISFTFSMYTTYNYPMSAFYLIPARAWEMGVGALFAITMPMPMPGNKKITCEVLAALGLVLICLSTMLFNAQMPFPGLVVLVPVSGTLLVIAARGSFLNRVVLGSKPMVGIGLISYSWYLWHWPIMAFARICSIGAPSQNIMLGCVLLSFGFAVLSWRYIERPFRTSSAPSRRVLWQYGLVLSIVLALPVAIKIGDGLPFRSSAEIVAADNAVNQTRHDPCLVDNGSSPNFSSRCVRLGSHTEALAILGDSHAAALGSALRDFAAQSGQDYAILTKASCRPFERIVVIQRKNPRFANECRIFMRQSLEFIKNSPSIKYVFISGLWDGPLRNPDERYGDTVPSTRSQVSLFKVGLLDTVQQLSLMGKIVVIVEDTPYWINDPVQSIRVRYNPLRSSLQGIIDGGETLGEIGSVRPRLAGIDKSIVEVSLLTKADIMKTKDSFCVNEICRYSFSGRSYFSDRSHLSKFGAERVWRNWIMP